MIRVIYVLYSYSFKERVAVYRGNIFVTSQNITCIQQKTNFYRRKLWEDIEWDGETNVTKQELGIGRLKKQTWDGYMNYIHADEKRLGEMSDTLRQYTESIKWNTGLV